MNLHKQVYIIFVISFLASANAFADTCFDPRYGYYDCYQGYYAPSADEAFIEGAFIGAVIGGFNNDDGYYENHHHWNGNGGGWNHQGGNHGGWGHQGGNGGNHGGGGRRH